MTLSDLPALLPWSRKELESILRALISQGIETSKIDFKREIETGTNDQKSEFLKDLVAVANTYDEAYADHGFLIYGVSAKKIVGIAATQTDPDKFQSHIEQIIKTYIHPMLPVYVFGFDEEPNLHWGVIVIPPRSIKPHMFFEEVTCNDRSRSRRKGDWFVRRGSTTDRGLPEDLAEITRRQTSLLLAPFEESITTLRVRLAKLEDQYASSLYQLIQQRGTSGSASGVEEVEADVLGLDLPARIKVRLRTSHDVIGDDFVKEAKSLLTFLNDPSNNLTWAPQLNNSNESQDFIKGIEERTRALQMAIAITVLNDSDGNYSGAIVRSLTLLAKNVDIPPGISFNQVGEGLRFYPLTLLLYTVFVCGVAARRIEILQKVAEIPIRRRRQTRPSHMTQILFYVNSAGSFFNHAYTQKSCAAVSSRIRQVLDDRVRELLNDSEEDEFFYQAEFMMALFHIDANMKGKSTLERSFPTPGLYLYPHEAQDQIMSLIRENHSWLSFLLPSPLAEILTNFDQNYRHVIAPNCYSSALIGFSAANTLSAINSGQA